MKRVLSSRNLSGLKTFAMAVLTCLFVNAQANDLQVESADGDILEVRVAAGQGPGPLFLWLDNQYAETRRPNQIADRLAEEGATVWQIDLLESLFLERSAEAIRRIDGDPVADLIDAALDTGLRPIVVVASDRMASPVLRGLHAWQQRHEDYTPVAGALLFFPNLYRGTPVAGEQPELLGIVSATNMPVMIVQPALGTNRARLPELTDALRAAGSPVYTMMIEAVRDYYLLRSETPETESFDSMRGPVPPEIEQAIADTPRRMLLAAGLLNGSARPLAPVDWASEDEAQAPPYGLVERGGLSAPDYILTDARGVQHRLGDNRGRVTLVNFWATWCPPCVHEIPSMNRLAAAYDEADFAIVSINFKESAEHILSFMKRVEVDFPVLLDQDGGVSRDWGVFAFPSSFILDDQLRVRYSVNTAIEWDVSEVREVIDQLLEEREASRLSGLSDRREPSGKARSDSFVFEAHSGSMQRKNGRIWTASPTGVADQPQVRQPATALTAEMAEIVRDPAMGLYKAYAEFKMARYDQARSIWLALAQRDVAEAWFNLGILAEDGLGEPKDPALALTRYTRGAESGSARAQYRLAQVYLEGRLVKPDRVQAEKWLAAAAEAGYEDARLQLEQLGRGAETDDYLSARMLESEGRVTEAVTAYQRLSDKGNLRARTRLAWMHEAGRGVERNLEHAATLFRSAAEAGDAEAQFALGVMLQTGAGQNRDAEEAMVWLRRSAAQGYPEAREALSR